MPLILRPAGPRIPLADRLRDLGRTRRAVAVAAGVFRLAALAGVVAMFALLDVWFHLPPLARGLALAFTLAAAGVVTVRGVVRPLRLRTDPLAVALELEDRFPRLNDALASAVAFEGDAPARPGRFARAAADRAERLADRHDFRIIVPTGACWAAFWLAAVALVFAAAVSLPNPPAAAHALTRFADPFGNHPWPPQTTIEVLAPHPLPARVALGEPFELKFAVRGVVPERAVVRFRTPGAGEFEEAVTLAAPDAAKPADPVGAVRLDPDRLPKDFGFRIVANDADTGWQGVTVAPPPRLVLRDGRPSPQLHVTFPAYTGLRPADLPDGTGVVEAPLGSRVQLRAMADVRLSRAELVYLGDRAPVELSGLVSGLGTRNPAGAVGAALLAGEIAKPIPVAVGPDGRTLDADFLPNAPGMYAIRFTDESGLTGTRLLELHLQADPPPTVSLLRPAAGKDPPVFAPEVNLPVEIAADDTLYGLRRVFLEYRVGRDGPLETIPLADLRPAEAALPAAVGAAAPAWVRPGHFDLRRNIAIRRFLRPDGTPARDGDLVAVRAAADDWDDVSVLKPPGRSTEFEFRVASKESIEAQLQKDLAALRPELLRARDQQAEARQNAADAAAPTPEARDKLQAAERTQGLLGGKVADPRDGLRAKAEQLRATVRANALPKSSTTARAEAAAAELARLADRELPAAEGLLGQARQQAAQPPTPAGQQKLADLLARAGRHQQAAEEGLTELLEQLEQWGGAGEVRGEARTLRDAVGRQAEATGQLPNKVPAGKPPEALTPGQRAELERAAGKLDAAADRAGQLLGKAARIAGEKDKKAETDRATAAAKQAEADELRKKAADPPPGTTPDELRKKAAALQAEADAAKQSADRAAAEAEALRKGVQAAGGQAVADDLRRAADNTRQNRPGESTGDQQAAAGRLDRMAGALAEQPREQQQADELRKKAKAAADDAGRLADAQDDLRRKVEEAGKIPDPEKRAEELKRLAREQDRLREEARDLAKRLTRDQPDAAREVRDAADRMQAARDDLDVGKTPDQAQADATDKLDRAQEKLDKADAQAARELGDEARRKLAEQVKALRDRQAAAEAEAARIQEAVLKAKRWDRPLLASLGDLDDRERALADEVRTVGEKQFARLPVFARLLTEAADAMRKAGKRATDRKQDALDADTFDPEAEAVADDRVRRPMRLALRRLDQLLDALKPDDPKAAKKAAGKDDAPGGENPPQQGGGGGGNGDAVPPLAQLKVLRAIQAELNDRTAAFAKANPDPDNLTDEQADELKELEQAQRDIAELFEKLAPAFQPPAAEGIP